MPSPGDIKAGKAYVEIGGDESSLVRSLNHSAQKLQRFGSAIRGIGLQVAGAGAAVFTPLAAAGSAFAEHGEAISQGSKKTGLGAEAFSTLGYAAQQSGSDSEALEKGVSKMSRTLAQAAEGSATANDALARLGITVRDLNGLSQEDRFKRIADSISNVTDPAAQAAAAMDLFGKGGAELLPLLMQGSKGIDAMQSRARELGLQWSGEDAEAAEKFSRSLKDLWDVALHGVDVLGSAVAPVMQRMADFTIRAAIAATAWVKQHKTLIATAIAIGGALLVAGTGLVVLGTAFSLIGVALGTVASLFGVMVTAVSAVLSPIGLVVAALAGGVVALLYFSGTGAAVGNALGDAFKKIHDVIKFVFDNTSTLSQAWAAAMTEGGIYIQEAWASVKGYLVDLWTGFKGFMSDVWTEIGINIAQSASSAGAAYLKVWEHVMQYWRRTVRATSDVISQDIARSQAEAVIGNKYEDLTVDAKTAKKLAIDESAANHPNHPATKDEIDKRAAELMSQFGGQRIGHDDAVSKFVLQIGHQTGENAAQQSQDASLNPQDKIEDAAFQSRLAKIDSDLAARTDELNKALDTQKATNATATSKEKADAKTTTDAAVAAAKKVADAALEKYQTELKNGHDASGEKSLADQLQALLAPLSGAKVPNMPQAGDLENSVAGGAKTTSRGAFDVSSQDLAREIFGGGSGGAAEQTAKNTAAAIPLLQAIVAKFPVKAALQAGLVGLLAT